MGKKHLLGLVWIMMVTTACGKSMHLVTKSKPVSGSPSVIASQNKTSTQNSPKSAIPFSTRNTDVAVTDGKLLPFSAFDMANFQDKLLFLDVDASNNKSAIGSPEFVIDGEADNEGFNKQSNLVFRAIKAIPPKVNAIKSVQSFKLVLHGVRVFNDGSRKTEDVLKNQVLCVVDTQKCAGGKIDPADKNINPLWKSAFLNEAILSEIAGFKRLYAMGESNGVIYEYRGVIAKNADPAGELKTDPAGVKAQPVRTLDLEIDLQKVFGITDADLPAWILANSSVYDTTGNYRKFRFELGNNIYAKDGALILAYTLDKSVALPSELGVASGNAKEGDSDVSKEEDYKTGIKVESSLLGELKTQSVLDENSLGFELDTDKVNEKLTAASLEKLAKLALLLNNNHDAIFEIDIWSQVDLGADPKASQDLANKRALLIKKVLSDLKVTAPVITKGQVVKMSGCGTEVACMKDRQTELSVILGKEFSGDSGETLKKALKDNINQIFGLTQ